VGSVCCDPFLKRILVSKNVKNEKNSNKIEKKPSIYEKSQDWQIESKKKCKK